MTNRRSPKKRRPAPKTVLRLPDLDQAIGVTSTPTTSGETDVRLSAKEDY